MMGRMKRALALLLCACLLLPAAFTAAEGAEGNTELLKEFEIAECVELQVNRPRTVGRYHLFNAQNPVYIFTFQYRKQP